MPLINCQAYYKLINKFVRPLHAKASLAPLCSLGGPASVYVYACNLCVCMHVCVYACGICASVHVCMCDIILDVGKGGSNYIIIKNDSNSSLLRYMYRLIPRLSLTHVVCTGTCTLGYCYMRMEEGAKHEHLHTIACRPTSGRR